MKKSKKYDYRVVPAGTAWAVEIIRRVTSKSSVVSKIQDGFATEAEAQEWGQQEAETFLKNFNLNKQKKRRAKEQAKGR